MAAKFYKLRNFGDYTFYPNAIKPSLYSITKDVIESVARIIYDEAKELGKKTIDYDKVFKEAVKQNIVNDNIILCTIPKIILCNVEIDFTLKSADLIDVTEQIINEIRSSIDFKEIENFVRGHSAEEIADKYVSNIAYIEQFWW